ncbi:MAG: PEP/pyruvate-binding domain-containing protein [Bacteroidota bacterium]
MQAKSNFIVPLTDVSAGLLKVGGKGASLARLAQEGLPVPPGFQITTDAYRQFVVGHGLQGKIIKSAAATIHEQPATLEDVSRQIQQLFAEAAIPEEIAAAICRAYGDLGGENTPVAVRSSATAEDLPGMSFAGQQETYLNIRGINELLDAVKKCWASLWTGRAIAYRIKNNIDQKSVALAVVVQEMVHAEASGILFTANPMNGTRDEIVLNATWGLGETIVSGLVSPDMIVADKNTGKIKKMDIATKTVITVETETGTQEKPLEDARRNSAVLNEAQVKELAGLARRIEDLFGAPQDIEWCQAKGRFYILQSRPITALPAFSKEAEELPLDWYLSSPHAIAMRLSFVELIPDVVSPLFATLAVPIASQFATKLMGVVMNTRGEAGYYFEVVHGYVYSCLDMRKFLKYLVQGLGATQKILQYGRARRDEVQNNSQAAANRWQQADLNPIRAVELVAGVRELFSRTADYFTVAQSGPIPASTMSEASFRYFYNALVRRKSDPPAETFLFGLRNLALQAETALFDLAQWAQTQTSLADYLQQTPARVVWDALQTKHEPAPLAGEFAARFMAHLNAFGYAIYDLDFSKPVPADDPVPLLDTLKVYLAGQGRNPHLRIQSQTEQSRQTEQSILRRLDPWRRRWFQKLLHNAQEAAPGRENAIADLGLTYPQIKRILRELGWRLTQGGAIACPEDIYWLEAVEVDELAACIDKREALANHDAWVEKRKADWQRAYQATPPAVLATNKWLSKLMASRIAKRKNDTLKGYGASPGKVTAPACVLRSPEDFRQMRPGDVLVAVTTTPAWTPLFAIASAIVTDIGGPLSHSSIVAREYGIPAVLATEVGSRQIHTGQMITVDGNKGIVMLVS